MENSTPVMDLTPLIEKFNGHIHKEWNEYLIFSGQYGIGKTYFLKEFFETKKDDFHAVFISPLKYTINTSESIFELIKLDIAMALFRQGFWEAEQMENSGDLKTVGQYFQHKPLHFLKYFLKALGQVNPLLGVAASAADGVTDLIEHFEQFSAESAATMGLENPAIQLSIFLNQKLNEKGQFGEMDIVTESIETLLDQQRKKDKKQWILVIDDFDRIDPEHVFRILNVLTAHQDLVHGGFKFGFDKIIIVCDYLNLEHLYLHKYGEKANFSGYIDKFSSDEVFYCTHSDLLGPFLRGLMDYQFPHGLQEFVEALVTLLFKEGKITLRNIVRVKGFKASNYENLEFDLKIQEDRVVIPANKIVLLQVFPLLTTIIGNYERMKRELNELPAHRIQLDTKNKFNLYQFSLLQACFHTGPSSTFQNCFSYEFQLGKNIRNGDRWRYETIDQSHSNFEEQKSWPTYDNEYFRLRDFSQSPFTEAIKCLQNTLKRLEITNRIKDIIPSANA